MISWMGSFIVYIQRVILFSVFLLCHAACTPSLPLIWETAPGDPFENLSDTFYLPEIRLESGQQSTVRQGFGQIYPISRSPEAKEDLLLLVGEMGELGVAASALDSFQRLGSIERPVTLSALSSSQRFLAVSDDLYLGIWDLSTLREVAVFSELKTRVSQIRFDPGTAALFIAGVDGRIYRWKWLEQLRGELQDRSLAFERYLGHGSVVSALDVHPQGRIFFSGDWRGNLSAWRVYDGDMFEGQFARNIFGGIFYTDRSQRRSIDRPDGSRVESLVVSPRGTFLALGTNQGRLELWGIRGFNMLRAVDQGLGLVRLLAFSEDEKLLASYGRDQVLRVWAIVSVFEPLLDQTNYRLVLRDEVSIPRVRALTFIGSNQLVAGDASGDLQRVFINLE